MSGEVRMRESNPREADDAQVGVDVLQNALSKKDQPHRNPNQHYAAWGFCGFAEELENSIHHGYLNTAL
jgi:hypothetical protein